MVSAWLLDMAGAPCAGARSLSPRLPMSSVSGCWTLSLHTRPRSPRGLGGCTSGPPNGHVSEASAVSPQWARPRPLAWSTGPGIDQGPAHWPTFWGRLGMWCWIQPGDPLPESAYREGALPTSRRTARPAAEGRGLNSAFGNTWKIPVKACQK